MHKRTLTIAVAAITGSLAFGGQAIAQESEPQGLYSANDIIGADVYHANDTDEEVGNVENILLDEQGQVSALIISAGGLWGMGGDDVVVNIEHFSMESERDDNDDVTHRILVDATEDELENFPNYDESWFNDERKRLTSDQRGGSVWQTTGTTAGTGQTGDDADTAFRDNGNGENAADYTDEDIEDDFE